MKEIITLLIPFVGRREKIRFLIKAQSKASEKRNYISYLLMKIINTIIYKKFHCDISPYAKIGDNIVFPHPIGIVIGEGVRIGDNVTIYQNVTVGRAKENIGLYPCVEDNVVLYANAMVIGGCVVKSGSTVGAHSLVLTDTQENTAWAGIPARCVNKPNKENKII